MTGFIEQECRQVQLGLGLVRGKELRDHRAGPDHGGLFAQVHWGQDVGESALFVTIEQERALPVDQRG